MCNQKLKTTQSKAFWFLLPLLTLCLALQGLAQCPTINIVSTSITATSCGATNGAVRIAVPTGGVAPYTYSWNTVPVRTAQNLLNVPAGSYTVTVKDKNNCTASKTFVVPLLADLVAPIVVCDGPMTISNDPGRCVVYLQPQDGTPVDFRTGYSVVPGTSVKPKNSTARIVPLSNRILYRPVATDNCGNVFLTATRSDGLLLFVDPYPVGTTLITWKATDGSGNFSFCTQTIIVIDDEKPIITLPANMNIVAEPNGCGAIVTWSEPTVTDNCGVLSVTKSHASGQYFPAGTTTVTYTATDIHGNIISQSFTVTVADRQIPTIITCPAPITEVSANGCTSTVSLAAPTATDNCTPNQQLTYTNDAPAAFPVGTTIVTWAITDAAGNTAYCTQAITILDQTNPVPVLPILSDISASCSVTVAPPQATECNGFITGTTSDPLTYTTQGDYVIHWTYTDASGNTVSQNQNVSVHDTEPPTIICPADITAMADQACGHMVDPGQAIGADNCTVTVTGARNDNQPLNACYPIGTTVITWTAVDGAGNTATCTQRIIITDLHISGTVYNDVNALTDNLINGTRISNASGQLYVNLVDAASNTVIATKMLTNGTFSFGAIDGIQAGVSTYMLVLTTNAGATSAMLPDGIEWINTGDGATGSAGDGNVDGLFSFNAQVVDGQVIDFGIEARPKPYPVMIAPSQVNPGGTNLVTIAPTLFSATDLADITGGEVRFLHISFFPTNTNSINFANASTVLGGVSGAMNFTAGNFPATGIYIRTNTNGNPLDQITVDPVDGAVTITMFYKAIDQANAESTSAGAVVQPLTDISISGTVYNDVNALTDNLINGTPVSNAGGQLYINLVDAATNTVVASKQLANGTFNFTSADGLQSTVTTYDLVLSTSASSISPALPNATDWFNTGDGNSGSAGDGNVNGRFTFGAAVVNGQAIDFGIEARPVPAILNVAPSRMNPGGINTFNMAPSLFAANDVIDISGGEVRYLHIVSFPTNTNTVYFAAASNTPGGVALSVNYTSATFPAGGIYLATNLAGNPVNGIAVDPVNGAVDIDFVYRAVDQANAESNNTGIARQPLTELAISGSVYNDANALTDNLINGTLISGAGGQLYVNLVNTATNSVVASKQLLNGTFSFSTADGLEAGVATYDLVLANAAAANSPALPDATNWVNTGDGNSGGSGDGTVNGRFTFGGVVVNGQAVDFGIEARPVPNQFAQAPTQTNPGATNLVAIAATLFSASDVNDLNNLGQVRYIHITSFPTNTTTVNFAASSTSIGGAATAVSYNAGNFPAGGVYLATNLTGNPLSAISVDPVDGAVNVDFTYMAIDQANVESNNSGIARQPLTELSISGAVYNDVNALTDNLINGTPISYASGQLFVNLVNTANNTVVASKTLTNGTFTFSAADGLQDNVSTYRLVLSSSASSTSASLPNNIEWLNTGDGVSGSGGDGNTDGSFTLNAFAVNGQAFDFGIEARPVPTVLTVGVPQVNPGGTNLVAILPTLFSATDASDLNANGSVRYIHIIGFPSNTNTVNFAGASTSLGGAVSAASYTVATFPAGGVYIATNAAGNPLTAISVDPVDGTVDVDIPYRAIDQANAESTTKGTARQPLADLFISGKVYDDANALTDNLINGTLISNAGGQLFVNLVNTATNTVAVSVPVVNGSFNMTTADGLRGDISTYKLVLASSATATSAGLPDASAWVNTGEGISGSAGDGTVDGSFTFGGLVVSGQAFDFGIEARPVPNVLAQAPSQPNPGGTNLVSIASTLFSATDATDLNNTGVVRYLHIISFPTSTTSVDFAAASNTPGGATSAVTYTAGNFPAGGIYVATNAAGNPVSAISVDPNAGNVTVDFIYKAVDQANVESNNTGIARQPLTEMVITGHVYDDVDAAVINGVNIFAPSGQQVYINLVDMATGKVQAIRTVTAAYPVFSFGNAAGVTASQVYRLVLSTTTGVIGQLPPAASIPSAWVNTGEGIPATSGDGSADGVYTFGGFITGNTSIDFGIEARPVPDALHVAAAVQNPGGTVFAVIAPTLFGANDLTDISGGEVRYIHILSFPTNTTTVSFAGASTTPGGAAASHSYTSATFPAGGVYIATNLSGNPVTAISADPVNGNVDVDFTYKAVDQANVESTTTGIARQPFFCPAPAITCPANILTSNTNNKCGAMVGTPPPTATSLCNSVSVAGVRSDNQPLNTLYPIGNTTITWTATDGAGATTTCTQTVTVNDTEKPSITCGGNLTAFTAAGTCSAIVAVSVPSASDNCTTVTVAGVRSDGQAINAQYPKGVTTISWTATDAAGNITLCTQTITVTDNIRPAITCAANISVNVSAGICGAVVVCSAPAATDNCGSPSVTPVRSDALAMSAAFPVGITSITWTATDASGNTATCVQTVTVVDNQKPVMVCPANVSLTTSANQCSAQVNVPTPSATDNCGTATVAGVRSDAQNMNAAFAVGATTITWTATDAAGNTTTCTQTVTVADNVKPVITCPASQLNIPTAANTCSASLTITPATATDNCGTPVVIGVRSDGLALTSPFSTGTTNIVWTATDASGNSATCTQIITVKDVARPTFTSPGPITACDNGLGNNKTLTALGTDNCGVVSVTWAAAGATVASGTGYIVNSNFNIGTTTITWTLKDAAGNQTVGSTTVTIYALPTAGITLTSNDSLCVKTVLTGTGGTSYQWLNGGSVVGSGSTLTLPLANCSGTVPFTPTASAQNFNVFVQGAVTASAGDTHGPVAMGGNLVLGGQTIFTMNTSGSYPSGTMNGASNYGMVIGGRVIYSGGNQSTVNQGYLRIGDATGSQIWYVDNNNAATNLKLTATGAGFNGNPSLMLQRTQPSPSATLASGLNFTNAFSAFATENNRINSWSSSAQSFLNKITIAAGSNPHITLADNKINYINLTAAQLNALNGQGSIIFDNAPTATRTLVFNVTLSGNFSWTPANLGGLSEAHGAYIIWNFNGSGSVGVDGSNPVYGTVFAPSSSVEKNNANNLNGQIIGQSLKVGPGEIHYYPFTSSLGYPGCSNEFTLKVMDANGCQASAPAQYTYTAPLNSDTYTILGLDAVTLTDNNSVQSGSVGVNNAGGIATVQGTTSINGGGAFLKAPVQNVAATAIVPTRISAAAGYMLPAMQYYTAGYTGLLNYTVPQNQSVTLASNYGDLYITKGATVTLTGTTFKSVTIEEGATVNFTSATVNMQTFTVGNGNNTGIAKATFITRANVRISGVMTIGKKSIVNQANNRVYFYLGSDVATDKVVVKGGGSVLNGVVLAPTGNIKVGTDAQNPVVTNATATNCTQTDGCTKVVYNGWTKNYDGTYTYKYTVSNACQNGVSHFAFELKNGSSALGWSYGSTYAWGITNGTNNPYRCIKFEHPSPDMSNNSVSDVLTYTVSAADFNALTTIRVTGKYGNSETTYTFNRDGCSTTIMPPPCTTSYMNGLFVGKTVSGDKCTVWNSLCGSGSVARIAPAIVQYSAPVMPAEVKQLFAEPAQNMTSLRAFPNPNNGSFSLAVQGIGAGAVQVQVINASGMIVINRQYSLNGKDDVLPFQLPQVSSGLYTIRVVGRDKTLTTRVMVSR
jgi:hypothetical protein